jgi:hypothetical protein
MGVYIKGMEMPKSCDKCELMTANYGCVFVGAVGGESYRKRAWDCPLIEVPKHGDLIDRDAINWEDEIWKKKCISPYVVYNTWVIAKELPVVIESEGE